MERYPLAIVIPAYNEEATIEYVVRDAQQFGRVIVIDDAGTDMTAKKAKEAGAEVLRNNQNLGYDDTLAEGLNHVMSKGYAYALCMDADGQHAANDIPQFIKAFDQGADIVIGVRPKTARLGEYLFKIVGKRLWGISDPLCGMKAYRLDWMRRYGNVDFQHSIGTRLAIQMLCDGAKLIQMPIALRRRNDQSRFGGRIKANMRIVLALIRTVCKYYLVR